MKSSAKKHVLFLISAAAAVAISSSPLIDLVRNGRPSDYYTHIPLVPVISIYVLFRRRNRLLMGEPGSPLIGLAVIAVGCGLFILDRFSRPGLIGRAELCAGAAILLLSGSFFALYGAKSFRRALFPFLFLWFIVPLPLSWMSGIVLTLVKASTGFTRVVFMAFGIPFVQEGATFFLPGFDIKVAQECSGIRSSIALLITSVLAGQVFLNRRWKKIGLALAVMPITVFKNAVRIATLYLLSYFVDMQIIEGGFLHRSGGFIFFGLGLVMLAYMLWLLKSPREAWGKAMGVRNPADKKGLTND